MSNVASASTDKVKLTTNKVPTKSAEEKAELKKILTLDLVSSQIDETFINGVLESLENIQDEDLDDDWAGDVKAFQPSLTNLTDEEKELVSSVISYEDPSEIALQNKYISEDTLSANKFEVVSENPNNNNKSGKFVKKEYTVHREDLIPFMTIDNTYIKREINMDWDKLLGVEGFNEDLEAKNRGYMSKYIIEQKSYQSVIDKIVNDVNYILNEYPDLGLKYLKFRSRVAREGIGYNLFHFLVDIADFVNDPKLRSLINVMGDSTYTLTLDEISNRNLKKIVEDLRVSDDCNSVFLKCSIMQRLCIPIINEYCKDIQLVTGMKNDTFKYLYNHLTIVVFTYILRYFSVDYDVNTVNKLHKIVDPRVKATNYSDKVIWKFLESYVMDDDIAVVKFTNKIIRTILPKIDVNKSAISFLDVVIRNMISSDFKYNFPMTHKNFSITENEDDDTSEMEKFAIHNHQMGNELDDILILGSIDRYIKNSMLKYYIPDEDFKVADESIKSLNELQYTLLNLYYGKKFTSLDKVTGKQKVRLLVIMRYKFLQMRLNVLADLIIGKLANDEPIKTNGRLAIEINRSKSYQDLKRYYTLIDDKFEKDGLIMKLSSIFNYDFVTLDLKTGEYIPVEKFDRKTIFLELCDFVHETICI